MSLSSCFLPLPLPRGLSLVSALCRPSEHRPRRFSTPLASADDRAERRWSHLSTRGKASSRHVREGCNQMLWPSATGSALCSSSMTSVRRSSSDVRERSSVVLVLERSTVSVPSTTVGERSRRGLKREQRAGLNASSAQPGAGRRHPTNRERRTARRTEQRPGE